jgi:hypothetical protein
VSKRVCTSGVVGSYSYLIVDGGRAVVAEIRDWDRQVDLETTTFPEMETALKWTDRYLNDLVRNEDEID